MGNSMPGSPKTKPAKNTVKSDMRVLMRDTGAKSGARSLDTEAASKGKACMAGAMRTAAPAPPTAKELNCPNAINADYC